MSRAGTRQTIFAFQSEKKTKPCYDIAKCKCSEFGLLHAVSCSSSTFDLACPSGLAACEPLPSASQLQLFQLLLLFYFLFFYFCPPSPLYNVQQIRWPWRRTEKCYQQLEVTGSPGWEGTTWNRGVIDHGRPAWKYLKGAQKECVSVQQHTRRRTVNNNLEKRNHRIATNALLQIVVAQIWRFRQCFLWIILKQLLVIFTFQT